VISHINGGLDLSLFGENASNGCIWIWIHGKGVSRGSEGGVVNPSDDAREDEEDGVRGGGEKTVSSSSRNRTRFKLSSMVVFLYSQLT
jgi:hypothetical protein